MSPLLATIPDAEALVGAWLREHEDIAALDARVAGKTPDTMAKPWVRVTRLAAPRIQRATFDHAIRFTLQFDCYAGKIAMDAQDGQREANLLGRTVRAVLMALKGTVADGVTVGGVGISTDGRFPDTTREPALERVILVADILMHPA